MPPTLSVSKPREAIDAVNRAGEGHGFANGCLRLLCSRRYGHEARCQQCEEWSDSGGHGEPSACDRASGDGAQLSQAEAELNGRCVIQADAKAVGRARSEVLRAQVKDPLLVQRIP